MQLGLKYNFKRKILSLLLFKIQLLFTSNVLRLYSLETREKKLIKNINYWNLMKNHIPSMQNGISWHPHQGKIKINLNKKRERNLIKKIKSKWLALNNLPSETNTF